MVCVHCDETFDPKTKFNRKGKVNECGHCAGKDVPKYIGMIDAAAKSGSGLNIFRTPNEIKVFGAHIRRANAIGFNANLPIGSTTSTFGEKE